IAQLQQDWKALSGPPERLTEADSNTKHADMIDHLLLMIQHSGEQSNLILDPDLDSYFLMDITLNRLPLSQNRIRKALSVGTEVLSRAAPTSTDTRLLDTFAGMLQEADRDNVASDTDTAL